MNGKAWFFLVFPLHHSQVGSGAGGSGNTSKLEEAKSFLKSRLSLGPVPAQDVLSQATAANISENTLRRAANVVGVKKSHAGEPG